MFKAKLNNVPMSAQKVRLVADLIRGKNVSDAVALLSFMNKKAAFILKKLCSSAIANAESIGGADLDSLKIKTVYVDKASSLKRVFPRAKGRADKIEKQRCHVFMELN
jgi:large subunit ribosomal protein L22